MAKAAPAPDVSEILNAARVAAAEGEAIIEKAREDHHLKPSDDEDGPLMQTWKRRDPTIKATPSAISEMLVNLIGYIVESDRAGRRVGAGAGLVRLREHYDNIDPRDLPGDEQSWGAFAAKHIPLPAARVSELIGAMVVRGGSLRCVRCGTATRCACGCGRPYVSEHRWAMSVEAMLTEAVPERANAPSALDRALAAVTADPQKSNRAIAAEIGVSHQTVKRAREQLKAAGDDVTPDVTPDRRTGRDGRSYPGRARPTPSDYFEAINAFHGELVGFLTDFTGRFSTWRADAGPLDDEGKAALTEALYLCGDGFMRVAQELDGR
jgi:hypothetical protein